MPVDHRRPGSCRRLVDSSYEGFATSSFTLIENTTLIHETTCISPRSFHQQMRNNTPPLPRIGRRLELSKKKVPEWDYHPGMSVFSLTDKNRCGNVQMTFLLRRSIEFSLGNEILEILAINSYLQFLTSRLGEGLARQPEDFRARHAAFLTAAQNADGGFSGREGGSDLYYTAFALRGLAILDVLTPEICARTADFLRSRMQGQAGVVDFHSLLFSCLLVQLGGGPDVLAHCPGDWPNRVAETLESFRTPDGGYGKTAGAASASTYHTFLVGLCYQILGLPWPNPEAVERFITSRHREDGGFVEVPPMRRSGTNPTAAGVGIWQLLHGSDTVFPQRDSVIDFLVRMPSMEGGLRANDRIPLADLLSTFTGLWTMDQLGALDRLDLDNTHKFALDLENTNGGFRAGLWDEIADVEYTFYGVGTVALVGPLGRK